MKDSNKDKEKNSSVPDAENDMPKVENDETADDVVFEPEEDGSTSSPQAKIKKLKDELRAAKKEREEYLAGWQRAKADFINARKEDEKRRGEIVKYANKELILDVLSALDSFDMAFSNKEAWEKVDKNWRMGVEYIYNQLLSILEQNGLKQLNPVGENFDPNIHTSVESVPVEKEEDEHKIQSVAQKGYLLNGSLIRSPKVRIWVKKES
jgi:molecular chaperone GrpE